MPMKTLNKYLIPIACLLLLTSGFAFAVPNESEASNKMTQITKEEQTIIEALFVLSTDIENLSGELYALNNSITNVEAEMREKEKAIAMQENAYMSLKRNLGDVLKIQQRAGIASNIEIILSAKNLKDLVNRINLLRDLSKNVDRLMLETERVRLQLTSDRETLEKLRKDMEIQVALLAQKVLDKNNAKRELENYLDSLATEKEHYQDYLDSIETLWASLKPLFAQTIQSFTEIIEKGDLPEDTVEVSLSLFNSRGIIKESRFNTILEKREDLADLTFDFKTDGVSLAFPSYEVKLDGYFELVDSQTIQYIVTGGEFYDLPMSESALNDLFRAGDFVFNLKAIMGNNTINKIISFEDRLELQITIRLF